MSESNIKVEDVRINRYGNKMELIVDFDNDRHHAIAFQKGDLCNTVVGKLRELAATIQKDDAVSTHLLKSFVAKQKRKCYEVTKDI